MLEGYGEQQDTGEFEEHEIQGPPQKEPTHPVKPISPIARPRPAIVITPRQERALRYLERKNTRKERLAQLADKNKQVISPQAEGFSHAPITPVTPVSDNASFPVQTATKAQKQLARMRFHRRVMLRHTVRQHWRERRQVQQRTFSHLWFSITSVVLGLVVVLLTMSSLATYAAYRFYQDTQYKYEQRVTSLHELLPLDNLKMYDRKGVMLAQLADQGLHTSVKLNQVSQDLINATVSTEDKDFWTNPGVDLQRIIRAAIDNLQQGHVVEGGSTITQQLIKNLVVGNDASIVRKLQEIVLTPNVNSQYTKQDIMEMYLNTIYYGEQAYGIDTAATVYFGLEDKANKPAAAQLDLAQAMMLAGLPNSPTANDPRVYPKAAMIRFQIVLNLMLNQHYITKVQALDALNEAQDPHFFKQAPSLVNRAPHFANFVLSQLETIFHLTRKQLSRSDMMVYTTLDIALQDQIQKIAQQHVAELEDTGHNVTNAAEVLIDYHTGAIISLLGSIDPNNKSIDGQFDVATQGYRQPGSSFKPYVYVTAFEQGYSPAQAVSDGPLTIVLPDSDPPTFTPENYDRSYHGHMTLRCALQNSLNIPAVRVLQHVGIDNAMQTAKDMGITSYEGTPGYSLVLGGLGVHLLDHTSAMGTFANNGVHVPYYAIEKLVFANDHQTYGHPHNNGTRVISPQLAYMMTNVLSDNESRKPEFYDCNVLQLYSNSQQDCWKGNRGTVRPAAAKTGTTTDFRDNWTMGYTTDYVMGVWTGNNNNTPMNDVIGVQGAAPIWHDAMLLAEQGHPIRDFTNPGGLIWAQATYSDGVRASDWFLPGTVPTYLPPPILQPTPGITPTRPPTVHAAYQEQKASPYCPGDFTFAGRNAAAPAWT